MTRRRPKTVPITRKRKATSARKRTSGAAAPEPAPIEITRLGFTCFRLVMVYDPRLTYQFRRLMETRATMGVFMRRAPRTIAA